MKKIVILFAVLAALMSFPHTSFSDSDDSTHVVAFQIFSQYQGISVHGTCYGDTMSKIKIEPFKKIYVRRITRVKWINYSDVPIRIKFGSGDRCKDISRAQQRTQYWRLSKECYITEEPIPQNGVLQIIFDEPGKYNYEIQFVGTKSTETAEVVVSGSPPSMLY